MAKLCPHCKAVNSTGAPVCRTCGRRFVQLEHRVAPYLAVAVFVSLAILALALLKC